MKYLKLFKFFDELFEDTTNTPSIFIDRLNDFLGMIDKDLVEKIDDYKNI